jgi:2-polyprenyl-3-methyl-5-hydroxy-6-metoxy-1,4-benzoquinol methylase
MASSNAYAQEMIAAEFARQSKNYTEYHARRFNYLTKLCIRLFPDRGARVLDIGRSYLSHLLAEHYDDVSTLGFPLDVGEHDGHRSTPVAPHRDLRRHLVFNLNDAQTQDTIGDEAKFDLILLAETIEHLYTAPELVLRCLGNSLTASGMIVCQTPNAAALRKRLQLLAGKNPYERLRCNNLNPGHFREYTKYELIDIGARAGLSTYMHQYADYFGVDGGAGRRLVAKAAEYFGLVAPATRRGQTIVYRRADSQR